MGRVVLIFKTVGLQVFNVACDSIVVHKTQSHVHGSFVMEQ